MTLSSAYTHLTVRFRALPSGRRPSRNQQLRPAEGPCPGADVFGSEVPDKFVDAGDLEISAEDHPDPFGFLLDDAELAVLQVVAKGQGTTHPKPLRSCRGCARK